MPAVLAVWVNSEAALWCCGDWADSEFLPDDGDEAFDWFAAAAAAAAELSSWVILTPEFTRLAGRLLCSVSEIVRLRGFAVTGVGCTF